jgi:hypothetical protein
MFDTYFLQTARFYEFPILAKLLGVETVLELLESKALRIHYDPTTFGQTGQFAISELRQKKGLLPLLFLLHHAFKGRESRKLYSRLLQTDQHNRTPTAKANDQIEAVDYKCYRRISR